MVNYRRVVIKHLLPERSGVRLFCLFFSRLRREFFFSTPRLDFFFSFPFFYKFFFPVSPTDAVPVPYLHRHFLSLSLSLLCRLVVVVAAAGVAEEAVEGEAVAVDVAEKKETANLPQATQILRMIENPVFFEDSFFRK